MKESAIGKMLMTLLCALTLLSSYAQDRAVTGIITDETGTPLQNATVVVKGTKISATTNANGVFTISVPASARSLSVSFVGMKAQDISIDGKSSIALALQTADTKMSEVVVVGYGTRRRAEVTSSIASVSEKDIKNLPVAGADQALQGKVAGVTVTNNGGQPGGGVTVRVRGITSVGNNEPLYVIDGVPMGSTIGTTAHNVLGGGGGQTAQSLLATLNPADIASIDILKDASAQAIYGSQAANGVILITTKRGKAGEGRINYDSYYGWQTVPQRMNAMNLSQYAQYVNEVRQEMGFEPVPEFRDPSVLGKGTNWQDGIYQTGNIQNHQLSFSGGKDKSNYYLSMNYFDQSGTIIGSGFKRYAMRFNMDNQLKSWFRAGVSANASRSNQKITLTNEHDGVVSIALIQSPAVPIRNADGSWGGPTMIGTNNFGDQVNPVAQAMLRDVSSVQTKVFGNVYGEIIFNKNLSLRNEVGYDFSLGENRAFQPTYKWGTTSVDVNRLREDRNNSLFWVIRNYLTYNQSFGRHDVNATLGHESQSSRWDYINGERINLATDNIVALNTGSTLGQNTGGGKGHSAMESYFARAGYTYNNKYALNVSVRRDASSNFGPNNRIGYFPAASVGWTVTNEEFMKGLTQLNYLKLRAGAGAVGNQNTGMAAAFTTNIAIRSTPFGPGGVPANVGNPNLGWESVITYNAGFDAGFFNKKVELTFDVYKKITSNMLLKATLPSFTGLGTSWNDIQAPVVNAGRMTNDGIDIGITTYNVTKKDFSWKTNLVFSHYKNNLNYLNDANAALEGRVEYGTVLLTRTAPGQPVGMFFGYVTDGIFRTQAELNRGVTQGPVNTTEPFRGTWLGDVRFKDLNGDNVINDKDVTVIGNPHPDFTYGLTNTFQYKSFDFSFFVQGSYGNDIFNYTRRMTEAMRDVQRNQLATVLDRYKVGNENGSLPRFNPYHGNNVRVSDRYVEDGSYLRIQNIAFGYNLPKSLISKARMQNARVYGSIQNLYTFTNYSGYDPELGAFNKDVRYMNIDNGSYPNPRSFTVGLNMEL